MRRGNFMQVTEQRIWDTTGAITGFLHRVHCKRIWLGAAATYMRFFPSIMKNYDYGQVFREQVYIKKLQKSFVQVNRRKCKKLQNSNFRDLTTRRQVV
ncbi:uncharacterized protein LOC133881931 isoform X2 [Alnus glutinosa]|uniref:uncharacterized protein LOC133881931 isoform X2 n=1 Tax=Alnus glutinosa TaxID=3517 RepID=UPI002D77FAF7|nr:uncharacterized protein LOC133881931 isoform X2 [Alnus glutinosa]